MLVKTEPIETMRRKNLEEMGLEKSGIIKCGNLLWIDPVSSISKTSMTIAARIISDPIQTIIPLFLMLLLPILFFSLIR